MENLKIEYIETEKLKAYDKNTRKHGDLDVRNIAKSIKKYGFNDPIGIYGEDNTIVEGHGRLLAAKRLGMDKVPVVRLDHMTDKQRREYAIAHNATAMLSEWDFDFLNEELLELDLTEFDFGVLDEYEEQETEIIEDEAPEIDEENEPTCKLGDIWQLGRHRLMCGDCTDQNAVAKLMNGSVCAIAFTSPPYNAGKSAAIDGCSRKNKNSKYIHDDNLIDYDRLLFESTKNEINNAKWAIVNIQMLSGNKRVLCDYLHQFKDYLCDIAIWKKTTTAPAMANRVMNSQFEFLLFFSKESNSRAVGTKDFRGTVSNVFECSPQRNNEFSDIHGATFTCEFASHYIETFCNRGEIVLDLFGGTGTTCIACEQLERTCYMMEIEPMYCDVIIKRWENLTGQKAIKIN